MNGEKKVERVVFGGSVTIDVPEDANHKRIMAMFRMNGYVPILRDGVPVVNDHITPRAGRKDVHFIRLSGGNPVLSKAGRDILHSEGKRRGKNPITLRECCRVHDALCRDTDKFDEIADALGLFEMSRDQLHVPAMVKDRKIVPQMCIACLGSTLEWEGQPGIPLAPCLIMSRIHHPGSDFVIVRPVSDTVNWPIGWCVPVVDKEES